MANNMQYIGGWNVGDLVREVAQLRTATNLLRLEIENRLDKTIEELSEVRKELQEFFKSQENGQNQ
ncbi:MAG: hypothetical protein J7L15_00135 [Clostridiales bacterium]|nr:hypothetical protein [Clostridiales bacterium]